MRGYLKYFKLQIMAGLQYRSAAIAGIVTQFFWGFMYVFIYQAFYANVDANVAINFNEIVTYVWLNQAFLALIFIALRDSDINESIKSGTVAYELCRPYNLYLWWYVKIITKKYASFLLRCSPILIVALLLPEPYGLSMPLSVTSFLLSIACLVLGSLVLTAMTMIVQIIAFFNNNDEGITSIFVSIANLLSGLILPVPLLPNIIQTATYLLPFRLIGDLPFRVYSGNIGTNEAFINIGLQLFWIIVLMIVGNMLMKKATKKIFIQGG
jgi:ABC-2 type transport system permease protein